MKRRKWAYFASFGSSIGAFAGVSFPRRRALSRVGPVRGTSGRSTAPGLTTTGLFVAFALMCGI